MTVLGQNPALLSNFTPQDYYGIVAWLNILLDLIGVINMETTVKHFF